MGMAVSGKRKMTKRKILRKSIPHRQVPLDICCDMENEIGKIIESLTKAKEKAEKRGYKNVGIRFDAGYNNVAIDLYGDIPETDAEMEKRKKIWMKKEDKERALYEELKKKFEGTPLK
jgi:hypothetical protein